MELSDLLERAVRAFEKIGIPYLVTGSVASIAYGEPRLTNDIDIIADMNEHHVTSLLAAFPADEFYVSKEAVIEAIHSRGQFNIIHPAPGLKLDIIIRQQTPFDDSRFARSRRVSPAESFDASFAAPEDVIIKKMEYYREGGSEKHLRDIAGILKISGDTVDREYIDEWARRLGLTDIWAAIQKRVDEQS